jgi:23S rRNA (cytidine1920-2'-O)/16S rRNA (cytidine1409-2'-O)-methyltransferase
MPFETVNETVDVIVADTSFISLKTVIPSAEKFMKKNAWILALIKPQFEAGKKSVGKGGVVKDPEIRKRVVQDLKIFFKDRGYIVNEVLPSPILGPKGNKEYLISLNFKKNKIKL